MKILFNDTISGSATPPRFTLMVDSSCSRNHHPLFLPPHCMEGTLAIAPAWRVGRLGKTIAARFAHRYIDAVTLVARLYPTRQADASADALDQAFDSAIVVGDWLAIADHPIDQPLTVSVLDGEPQLIAPGIIEPLVQTVTDRCTIKTGDIITAPAVVSVPVSPLIEKTFHATLDGHETLSFKIK